MFIRWAALSLLLIKEKASSFALGGRKSHVGASSVTDTRRFPATLTKNTQDLEEKESIHDFEEVEESLPGDSPSSTFSVQNRKWLEQGTEDVLDLEKFPLGSLTADDVETIAGIMSAWARRKSVDAALLVEKLLKRIVDDLRAGNSNIMVSTRLYTMAIDAWAKSGQKGVAQRAQHIHDGMIEMYNQTGDEAIAPSTISYNTLINAWSKTGEPDVAARMAEKAFCALAESYKNSGNQDMKPDSVTFSSLIDCYGRCKAPNRTERAQELFDMMDELNVKRNVYSYSALQSVYARSGLPNSVAKAMEVLQQMIDAHTRNEDALAKPNVINFNAMISAYCNSSDRDMVDEAEQFLERMERAVSEGGFDVEPDRLSYALTIFTAARCPDTTKGAERAEALLERMEARSKEEQRRKKEVSSAAPASVELDLESFNCVLRSLGRTGAADRAVAIAKRMEKYAENGHESVRPNAQSWNMVLNAYARSRRPGAAQAAHDLLDRMYEMYREGQDTKPDIYTYAAVLAAYQRSVEPEKGDRLVREMEELYENGGIDSPPDVYHYTIVCSTWAKSGQKIAPARCAQILSHMIQRHQEGYPFVKPNSRTYNAVISCLSRGKLPERTEQLLFYMLSLYKQGDKDAAPDTFSFNAAISTWTRAKTKGSGKRAEAILERLIEYSEVENPQVQPDARCFNHIIGYYRFARDKAPDFPYRAEYLLNRMVVLFKQTGHSALAPNNFSFESAIEVFAYSKNVDAGEAADRLLKTMRRLCNDHEIPRLKPDSCIMNAVMHAWSLSGHEDAGDRIDARLEEMESQYASGVKEMQPETRSYGLVLSTWSRSDKPDKLERSLGVLRRMEAQHREGNNKVELNEHAYALVINACAFTNGSVRKKQKSFCIARAIFDRLVSSESTQPSSLTYGWFIEAAGRLSLPANARESNVAMAFNICCENGKVSDFVLDRLRKSSSSDQYRELLATAVNSIPDKPGVRKPKVAVSQLPREWSMNNKDRGPVWT